MSFTFQANQLVVNLLASERMTAGRAYRVHSSYDGHSGCGAQEWCRVADDSGRVVGFDPDRFILASAEGLKPNPTACAAALRSRKSVENLLREFRGESFKVVRQKLEEVHADLTAIVAETAEYPEQDRITFQSVENGGYRMQSVVGVGTVPVAWLRYPKDDDAYTLTIGDETLRLKAADYQEAMVETQAHLKQMASGEDFGFWAITRHVETCEERQKAFADALA